MLPGALEIDVYEEVLLFPSSPALAGEGGPRAARWSGQRLGSS